MYIYDLFRIIEVILVVIVLSEAFRNGFVIGGVDVFNGGDFLFIIRK